MTLRSLRLGGISLLAKCDTSPLKGFSDKRRSDVRKRRKRRKRLIGRTYIFYHSLTRPQDVQEGDETHRKNHRKIQK
jgi:hypothetical protein